MEMQVTNVPVQDSLSKFISVVLAIKFSVFAKNLSTDTEKVINQLSGSGTGDCNEMHSIVIGSAAGSDYYSFHTDYYSCIDNEESEINSGDNESCRSTNESYTKVIIRWIVVIINFLLELASIILDQLSSPRNSIYALVGMVISFAIIVICIIEIAHKGRKEKVTWKRRGMIFWFYHPSPSNKRFGSFKSILGLVFAIFQSIFATISYAYHCHHHNNPIKISFLPAIFAFCLLCSKLCEEQDKRDGG